MSDQEVDSRIPEYIDAIEHLRDGQFENLDIPVAPYDAISNLGVALTQLAHNIEKRYRETETLNTITLQLNAGLLLDEILENVFTEFRKLIPYDRSGFALIESTDNGPIVRARWAKSNLPDVLLGRGYAAALAGSSLETILQTGQPRIINDLRAYLEQKPHSASTRLIVNEGIRASLTCPLIVNGSPVGFLFFSSMVPDAYRDAHVELFQQIASRMSVILEKGRLISEIIEQRGKIDQQNVELRKLNEMKNTFLGIAAHDLRNPISNIQMALELLLMPGIDMPREEVEAMLGDMRQQTRFMLGLLNDLLDITQIESGQMKLARQQVTLAPYIAEIAARHDKLAMSKDTRVVVTPIETGAVLADPALLRQVLDNLISNAIKYAPPGSTVTVAAQHQQDAWRISVHDEGPGITEADSQHLFQAFARLSALPTGGEKSTGLGLSITRRIVEAHGGHIDVDSEPGHGSCFWFTLPDMPPSPSKVP